jgi:hypothetical protein
MIDTTRSRPEVLREGIASAVREAEALLVAGDRGARAHTCLAHAMTLATTLKALSLRMGSAEGYDDAVRILASIEKLQAELKPATGSKR